MVCTEEVAGTYPKKAGAFCYFDSILERYKINKGKEEYFIRETGKMNRGMVQKLNKDITSRK